MRMPRPPGEPAVPRLLLPRDRAAQPLCGTTSSLAERLSRSAPAWAASPMSTTRAPVSCDTCSVLPLVYQGLPASCSAIAARISCERPAELRILHAWQTLAGRTSAACCRWCSTAAPPAAPLGPPALLAWPHSSQVTAKPAAEPLNPDLDTLGWHVTTLASRHAEISWKACAGAPGHRQQAVQMSTMAGCCKAKRKHSSCPNAPTSQAHIHQHGACSPGASTA